MSAEEAPIAKLAKGIQGIENKTRDAVKNTAARTSNLAQNILKDEIYNNVEKKSIITTPFHITGDIIGATAGNVLKRTTEVVSPGASAFGSLYNTTIGAIFNPIKTITSPLQYLKNLTNIPVSMIATGSNLVKSALKVPHRFWDKGIRTPVNRLNFHIEKIPVLGNPIAGITNWVTGSVSKVTGGIVKGADWITSPIDGAQRITSA